MYLVFPDSMLDIAGLFNVTPGAVQLMQLDCHLSQVLHVKGLHENPAYISSGAILFHGNKPTKQQRYELLGHIYKEQGLYIPAATTVMRGLEMICAHAITWLHYCASSIRETTMNA